MSKSKSECGNDWEEQRVGVLVDLSYIFIVHELAKPNMGHHVSVTSVIISPAV